MDQLIEFGVFAGKLLIVFLFIMALVVMAAALIMKQKLKPDLQVENINEKLDELEHTLKNAILNKKELKEFNKNLKQKEKDQKKTQNQSSPHIYVLEFKGDLHAHAVKELRDEVTAVITVANPNDEVVVRIESPGGTVHGYGLAAAQLIRIKDANLKLTACVDLVAASGGYMMACTAHKIVAAPFSIIGSIGVLAQVPNFHKLLKKNDVDYEEISSGEYKRTVSILGEITEKGRAKFQEQIVDTHALFKDFVASSRPQTDISKVATGEYWYGMRAKELHLVDELMTSDQYLLERKDKAKIFTIKYQAKKTMGEKISDMMGRAAIQATDRLSEKFMETPKL